MKKIIKLLITELQKGVDESENFGQFVNDANRFLIDKATQGKRVRVTATSIYTGLILPVEKVYWLPTSDSPAKFELDLTGTEISKEKGYGYTVMWETHFEWVDDVTEYETIKKAIQ